MNNKITTILFDKIIENNEQIEDFFVKKFLQFPPLFYNSVDLRHCGFKIAPVDTNCFPAGFNNLSKSSINLAKEIGADFFNQNFPNAKKILIIPENHTRNLNYFENIFILHEIISSQKEVIIGSLILEKETEIELNNGKKITIYPIQKELDILKTSKNFIPDVIVINNDLTDGIPEMLLNLKIPVIPSPNIGWHNRKKSTHFEIYNNLATELSAIISIDPWLISPMQESSVDVDFKNRDELSSLNLIAEKTDNLLSLLAKKYQEYQIEEKPYCYVKADSGTYGMAVMPIFSAEEVLNLNKKDRNKMSTIKSSVKNTQVLIQEGIKTIDLINNKISEPMIYLINGKVVGNLFRSNENKNNKINLNSSGMVFSDLTNLSENEISLGLEKEKITKIYSLIGRIAALASAVENSKSLNI
jgi:glutamate--cysteine ligase